jgi:hypothetical protein
MTTQTTNTIPFSLVEKYAHIILISASSFVWNLMQIRQSEL